MTFFLALGLSLGAAFSLALKECVRKIPQADTSVISIIPLSQHKHVSNNYCFEAQVYLFSLVFLALSCAQLSVASLSKYTPLTTSMYVYIMYIRFRLVALTFKN